MPRIEEIQLIHWGSLRPDPVPLLTDGINVATGPNGSGKTCFLDAIKVLLGITSFAPGRSSAKYIFDGGPGGVPAEQALLRATFANPVLPERHERAFAAVPGCGDVDRVSVVCLVTKRGRRYRTLPGRLRWGLERPLEEDLIAFMEANPESEWVGPRLYEELLERVGVTRALREVLAIPQGAIDRIVEERPPGLLRNLLELTGEGAVLEAVHAGRESTERARAAYVAAIEQDRAEQEKLVELQTRAARYLEWAGLRDRLTVLEDLARPAADYRDLHAKAEHARAQREAKRREIAADQGMLSGLAEELPLLQTRMHGLTEEADALAARLAEAAEECRRLDARIAVLEARVEDAQAEAVSLRRLMGELAPEQAEAEVRSAETALQSALARRREVADQLARSQAETAALERGGLLAPPEVEAFKARLAERGIHAAVVAELLELTDEADGTGTRVEAALGDALWGLAVPFEAFREATALAAESGYRWPVVRAGAGDPSGTLARVLAPSELGLLLERSDALPALDAAQAHGLASRGHPAVTPDGMRYSAAMARLEAPERPVLGRATRERYLAAADAGTRRLADEASTLDARIPDLRAAWHKALKSLEAVRERGDRYGAVRQAERELDEARAERPRLVEREARLAAQLRELDEQRGSGAAELGMAGNMQAEVEGRLAGELPELAELDSRLVQLEAELEARRLTPEQQAVLDAGDLPGTESLLRDVEWLIGQVADAERFPPEVRDRGILAARDAQALVVEETVRATEERRVDLELQQHRVDDSRQRFDDLVREVVGRITVEFGRICDMAGWKGELLLIPGERPDDYGVDVLVAQRPGERLRSYRDAAHSGGQRATIAIVLLLATMGAADAADLLIMDEHIAHLDSTNIDHVAALMHALGGRVQFVLATPTNAESLRLSWCDLQLAFLPRDPGRAYSPPIRLLSRLGIGDLEQRLPEAELIGS
ncbi:MAG TPA: ATP-binding protein [Actinomycetota bacterium]|nr:ATP-binding protein [Actinomycetota bacterium]